MVSEQLATFNFKTFFHSDIYPIATPIIVTLLGLAFGLYVNRKIKSYVRDNYDLSGDTFKFVLFKSMQGLPITLSLLFALYILIDVIPLPKAIDSALYCLLLGLGFFSVARILTGSIIAVIELKTAKLGRGSSSGLLTSIISITIYALFTLTFLSQLGVSITPLITALGIGSMAIAFGLQETMANLFAGIQLVLSKQIRIDDFIKLSSGEIGKVSDISWRFTTILSSKGNAIIIPNQKMASATVTNYNMPQKELSVVVEVGVSYDSDLDKVERVALEVANEVTQELEGSITKPPALFFQTFGESAITFNVILHPSEFVNKNPMRHAFIKALAARFRAEHIQIPFPVRTIVRAENAEKDFE